MKGTGAIVRTAAACSISAVFIWTTVGAINGPRAALPSRQHVAVTDVWAQRVVEICRGALLFDGTHAVGTEQGAIGVARDIRASTERRLKRIEALPERPRQPRLARRWLDIERRLANVYASSYLAIWHVIAAAKTPAARSELARRLSELLHRPDPLRTTAGALEARLKVPDCTGGDNTTPPTSLTTSLTRDP